MVETYVRGRKAQPFIRGAQRRLEARIGQLLGVVKERERTDLSGSHDYQLISHPDRITFRQLAQALGGNVVLSDDEWRNSRRKVVQLIRERQGHAPPFSSVIKPTDNWNFSPVVYGRINGESGHGYIPGDVYANCLWYWTKAGDIVAAPMAGSGQIMEVYLDRAEWAKPEPWDLDIRMFDLTPQAGDYAEAIIHNDITRELPLERANYIVMDVPYFGMVKGQYSKKSGDLANMDQDDWSAAIAAIAQSCARVQQAGDLCTVIAPNHRDFKTKMTFLATTIVRTAFSEVGYHLHDLAYASRRIQQTQHAGMGKLNNIAKRERVMMTDIAEIMTFRRELKG
jgi:ParB family chromosome partitioning protein